MLATPRSFSQPTTSFIASQCQGIRQTPLLCLISRFVSEETILRSPHRLVPCRGRTPTRRPCLPFLPLRLGRRSAENLDFKTSSDKRCQRTITTMLSHRVYDDARAPRVLWCDGGGRRDRTDDLLLAKQALSQLSYAPVWDRLDRDLASSPALAGCPGTSRQSNLVGQGGFEPPTSRLSSARSNQLSY